MASRTRITKVAGVVEVIDNAVPNAAMVLDEIVSSANWNAAKVGSFEHARIDQDLRDNDIHWINPFDFRIPPILYEFVKGVWGYLDDYGTRYKQGFGSLENVNVNRYMPGQRYHVHADADGAKVNRVISALVYLNDNFTGGETEFVHFDERITPKAGRLVIFPSNYAYAHAALPPTDGVKYSAAFWTNA